MQLRGIPVGKLCEAHIDALVDNQVAESRDLDYKRQLPDLSPEQSKLEFLKDVSSFANTRGGVMLFGVECKRTADSSVAERVCGVDPTVNVDRIRQQWEAVLRDGLDPRIPPIEVQEIQMPGRGVRVVALGISQSIRTPHLGWFGRNGQVWRRSQAGKYQANVEEIRHMVRESDSLGAELETYRERRYQVLRGRGVQQAGVTFVHILPVGRLDQNMDLVPFATAFMGLSNVFGTGWGPTYNFDGYYIPAGAAGQRIRSFTQWLRCGGYELFTETFHKFGNERGYQAYSLTNFMHERVPRVVTFLNQEMAVDPPFALMLTIQGVQSFPISDAPDHWLYPGTAQPIDRDALCVSPALIEDPTRDVIPAIDNVLRVVWQSGGFASSPQPARRV